MKKIISVLLVIVMYLGIIICVQADQIQQTVVMAINNPIMTVDGVNTEIDPGRGTVPVILNDRTILPVRTVVEALGGLVEWDDGTSTATITYEDHTINLTIDSTTAYLDGEIVILDVAPIIINDRTYLPIRFIAEGFGWDVNWNESTQEVTIVKTINDVTETEVPKETLNYNANFDLERGTVMLNNGVQMPILGIGTFNLTLEQAENSVYNALKYGYTGIGD